MQYRQLIKSLSRRGQVKCFLLLYLFTFMSASAQDISQIGKSDPLIITGAVGTSNTYHYTNVGSGYASPLNNSVYANMNISLYGFSMPFSIYYSNDNLDFNYPKFSFNLQPHYKNWTGYIGQSGMNFSSYVMSMGFNGVGVEYDSGKLRFGAFYGILRNAVNDDPTDPFARRPQYKRVGWGFKVGYGTASNYIDLFVLRANDRPKSLNESWRKVVLPQQNFVVGLRGGVRILKSLSFTGNLATSLYTGDVEAEKISVGSANKFEALFEPRVSSMVRFAGDVSLNYSIQGINASLYYRLIQPDYTSLGTYYMSNNFHGLGLTLTTNLFNTVSIGANFSGQEDNLTNKQLFTTRGFIYSLSASSRLGQHFNLAASYNGYLQTQGDGTAKVNDSTRVHRVMHSFTLAPSFMAETETLGHTVTLSASYTQNKDLNKFSSGQGNVKSTALGLSYNMNIKSVEMDVSTALSHQVSKGWQSQYSSDVASVTASRAFLKEKNLTTSLTGSLCYSEMKHQSKSLSIGFDVALGYVLKQCHAFSFSAGLNTYGDVNQSKRRSHIDSRDFTCSLNYNYTFSLVEIKRKAEKAGANE